MMTNAVATIIQATSPLLATGAGAADAGVAAADAASAGAAGAAVAAAGAAIAALAAAGSGAASAASADPAKPAAARPRAKVAMSFFMMCIGVGCMGSERVLAGLAGADAHDLLEGRDEHLAVADLASAGGVLDRLDDAVDEGVVDRRLDLHFR